MTRILARLEEFLVGWRFPSVVALTLLLFAMLLAAVLAIPVAPDGPGAFAQQFRVWCFGVDPESGGLRFGAVVAVFSELVAFVAMVVAVWRRPLVAQLRARRAAFAWPLLASVVIVAGLAGGFVALGGPAPADPTIFPARELRIAVPGPSFSLTDQDGASVSLEQLKGRVVLITGVYATCGLACPRIMGQAKRAVATLSAAEREDVTVLGITLDPEHDDVATLKRMADAQRVEAPLVHLLTGESAEVNRVLDRLDVARRRNPETGLIDHANVFLVFDRAGRLSYRFSLDARQEQWLGQALKLLVAEPRDATARRE